MEETTRGKDSHSRKSMLQSFLYSVDVKDLAN